MKRSKKCPRCASTNIVSFWDKAKYGKNLVEWFRCDHCGNKYIPEIEI